MFLRSLGTLLVYNLAHRGPSNFPRWLLLCIPTVLSLGSTVFRPALTHIPAPVGGIILGGWINGSFVIFFAIATFVFWSGHEKAPDLQ